MNGTITINYTWDNATADDTADYLYQEALDRIGQMLECDYTSGKLHTTAEDDDERDISGKWSAVVVKDEGTDMRDFIQWAGQCRNAISGNEEN